MSLIHLFNTSIFFISKNKKLDLVSLFQISQFYILNLIGGNITNITNARESTFLFSSGMVNITDLKITNAYTINQRFMFYFLKTKSTIITSSLISEISSKFFLSSYTIVTVTNCTILDNFNQTMTEKNGFLIDTGSIFIISDNSFVSNGKYLEKSVTFNYSISFFKIYNRLYLFDIQMIPLMKTLFLIAFLNLLMGRQEAQ